MKKILTLILLFLSLGMSAQTSGVIDLTKSDSSRYKVHYFRDVGTHDSTSAYMVEKHYIYFCDSITYSLGVYVMFYKGVKVDAIGKNNMVYISDFSEVQLAGDMLIKAANDQQIGLSLQLLGSALAFIGVQPSVFSGGGGALIGVGGIMGLYGFIRYNIATIKLKKAGRILKYKNL